jgi:hypothetical protein
MTVSDEEDRLALLRLAASASELYDARSEEELIVVQLSWLCYFQSKPDRWKKIMGQASRIFDPAFRPPVGG